MMSHSDGDIEPTPLPSAHNMRYAIDNIAEDVIITLSPSELRTADRYLYWDSRVQEARKQANSPAVKLSGKLPQAIRNLRSARRWCRYWALKVSPAILMYMANLPEDKQDDATS